MFQCGYVMDVIEIFKEIKLRKTAPRVAIITILSNSLMPLSENEIKAEMGPLYDRITFYRSVQRLLEVQAIHRIIIDNATVKYAFNRNVLSQLPAHEHVHFYCTNCQTTICLEQLPIQKYQLPEGFVQEESAVLIKGLCDKCSSKDTL